VNALNTGQRNFTNDRVSERYFRSWQILLQKSAITMREDCLDLLTRLPTMPLLASGSAPTRDLAPLWLGKACIERWWRSSDQFCEAA